MPLRFLTRRMASVLLALILVGFIGACSSPESRRDSFCLKGQELLAAGKTTEAILEIKNAIQIDPKYAPAYLLLGQAALKSGDIRKAYGAFSNAAELDQGLDDAQISLAKILLIANKLDDAENKARLVLSRRPENVDAKLVLATALLRRSNGREGRQILEEIVRLVPTREEPHLLQCDLALLDGTPQKAVEALQLGIQQIPASKVLRLRLADLYADRNEFKATEELLTQLIAEDPSDKLKLLRARLYQRQGDLPKAVAELEQLIAANRSDEGFRLALAQLYLAEGKNEEAGQALQAGIKDIQPGYGLRFALSELYLQTGNATRAEDSLKETLQINTESPRALDVRKALAKLYLVQGESEKVLEQLRAVFERSPNDAEAQLLRGRLYLEEGEPAKAIPDLRAVAHEGAGNVEAQLLLARAHFMNNEPLVGAETLRLAVSSSPSNVPVRLALADFYVRNRDYDRALQEMERIAQLYPANTRIGLALGDVMRLKGDSAGATKQYKSVLDKTAKALVPINMRLASMAIEQSDFAQAQRLYDEALKENPQAMELQEAKATAYLLQGENGKALVMAEALSRSMPDNPLALDLLGRVEASMGRIEEAKKRFFQAAELAPTWVTPYYRIGGLYLQAGMVNQGIAAFENALKNNPDSQRTAFILGTLYQEAGRIAQAESMYKALLDRQPNFLPAANNLAYLYAENSLDTETLKKALALAVRAARDNSPQALDTLGWVYYKMGNREMALDSLYRAWNADSANQEIALHLAKVYAEAGAKEKAKAVLQQTVKKARDGKAKADVARYMDSL